MKNWILKIVMAAPLLSLTACLETTHPMCGSQNQVDIQGFDRTFSMAFTADPTKDLEVTKVTIKKTGTGEYQAVNAQGQSESIKTCDLGSWKIAEMKTENGTYQQWILSIGHEGVLSMSQLFVDAKTLAAKGIPYQFVDRSNNHAMATPEMMSLQGSGSSHKVLVVDNSSPRDQQVIGKKAKPLALGYTMF